MIFVDIIGLSQYFSITGKIILEIIHIRDIIDKKMVMTGKYEQVVLLAYDVVRFRFIFATESPARAMTDILSGKEHKANF